MRFIDEHAARTSAGRRWGVESICTVLCDVIAALLIFLVAAAVAPAAVGGLVHRTMGDTPTGRVVRSAAPTLVMAIAVFMILNQLGKSHAVFEFQRLSALFHNLCSALFTR